MAKKQENAGTETYPLKEPRFIPGYTGHCPDLPHEVGETYGRASHNCLERWPYDIDRLSATTAGGKKPGTHVCKGTCVCKGPRKVIMTNPPVYAPGMTSSTTSTAGPTEHTFDEDLQRVRQRVAREACPLLNEHMICGYGGHVPVYRDIFGKNYNNACIKGIATFDREQCGEE